MFKRYLPAAVALSVLVSVIVATGVLFATEARSVKWRYDFDKAAKEARKMNKPIMVDFYTDWCGWCRKLDREVYTDAKVIELSRKFVCVKVDGDKAEKLLEKYGVQGFPTIIFLDSRSTETKRIVGYRPADKFRKAMREALKKNR